MGVTVSYIRFTKDILMLTFLTAATSSNHAPKGNAE